MLIKCIEGLTENKQIIPELANYNIAQKLCDLFNFTKDIIVRKIAVDLLVSI